MIDHTVLAPNSRREVFVEACRFAVSNRCASVCICPFFVRDCAELLRGSGVKTCTVIGFPHGTAATAAKVAEAQIAMEDGAEEIDPEWVSGRRHIGVTAGASAPEVLVESVIARLKELGAGSVRQLEGVPERVTFPLPKELQVTN